MGSITDTLVSLGIWNWWILAGVLLALELLVPSFFFLWFGAAALVVGILVQFVPLAWQTQIALFAVLSIVALFASRLLIKRKNAGQDDSFLNRRGDRHVGKVFKCEAGIENGRGRVRIDDTIWLVSGPDCAAGSAVRVTGVDGATLQVEPA